MNSRPNRAFILSGLLLAAIQDSSFAQQAVQAQAAVNAILPATCGALTTIGRPLTGAEIELLGVSCTPPQDAQGLQSLAHEESAGQGTNSTETSVHQLRAIGARLAALRAGATGFQLSGLGLKTGKETFSLPRSAVEDTRSSEQTRLGAFVNANYHDGERDQTSLEDGFDFDTWGAVAGVDYRFTDSFVAGAAVNYLDTDTDIKNVGGSNDSDSTGLSLYSTYFKGEFYLDGHLNYSRLEFDTKRIVNVGTGTFAAEGDPDGDQFTWGVGSGYNFSSGAWTFTPFGRLEYLRLEIDDYRESGGGLAGGLNLEVGDQTVRSLQSALGLQVAYAISTGFGVLIPQVTAEWNHEFKNDDRSITARFISDPLEQNFAIPTEDPDRNYFTLGLGISGAFPNGISGFIRVETVEGLSRVDNRGIIAGVRLELR